MLSCDSPQIQSVAWEIASRQIEQCLPWTSNAQLWWPHVNCCPSFLPLSDSDSVCSSAAASPLTGLFTHCTFHRWSSTCCDTLLDFLFPNQRSVRWPRTSQRLFLFLACWKLPYFHSPSAQQISSLWSQPVWHLNLLLYPLPNLRLHCTRSGGTGRLPRTGWLDIHLKVQRNRWTQWGDRVTFS